MRFFECRLFDTDLAGRRLSVVFAVVRRVRGCLVDLGQRRDAQR